ncbi:MAG: hypothetical protein M3Q69_08160 [Acidobacteriota bacterium]|nr:hypothetical protein [Acidobacteriota bacterium]
MDLRLRFPPVPEHAGDLADQCVAAAQRVSQLDLDYTPESLKIVDGQLAKFRAEHLTSALIGETFFCFGCYAGEVFARNLRGWWVETTKSPLAHLTPWPMVVALPNGDCWNPIGKVFKRVDEGEEDSVSYMYEIAKAGTLR